MTIVKLYVFEIVLEIVENKKICVIIFVINNDFVGLFFLFVFLKNLGKSLFFVVW